MSKRFCLIASLCAMLCGHGLYAQDNNRRMLGIDEMFRLADENSSSIKSYSTGKDAAAMALKSAKAQRLPDINASLSASYLGDGNLWDRDFSNGQTISMPHFGNNFALQASMTVYAGGAINSGIALAELGEQMATLDWQKNRQDIRFLLTGYYLNLFKLNNQAEVLEKNIELTKLVIKNMVARRKQGSALKNDITRYELQLENQKLQLTKVNDAKKIMNHQLVTTLHLPGGTEIVPDTTLLANNVVAGNEDEWQQKASTSNLSLQQSGLNVEMSRQKEKLERSELLPKIAIIAEEHLDGPITIEVPVLDNNFNYWFVGVGVKYNISSLFKSNKKVKQARLQTRRAMEEQTLAHEQVENAVQAAYTDYLTSFTELQTQTKKTELANQNYKVTDNRYRNNLALLTDMLDASNTKLDAELGLVNARIDVIYNYYKMKYLTHTL